MKRKIITILSLILVLAMGSCPNLYAAKADVMQRMKGTITLQYVNSYEPKAFLGFTGNTAECDAYVGVKPGVTKVDGTLKLQRVNSNGTYTQVNVWAASTSGSDLYMSQSATVTAGYTYVLTFTAKVYKGSSYETVSTQTSGYC